MLQTKVTGVCVSLKVKVAVVAVVGLAGLLRMTGAGARATAVI